MAFDFITWKDAVIRSAVEQIIDSSFLEALGLSEQEMFDVACFEMLRQIEADLAEEKRQAEDDSENGAHG